ncbi:MAG: MFS transporter [Allosphingosinicella sp.]
MASAAAPADVAKLGGRAAWTALILVVLVQALSLLDRQVLAILVPRIREDLGVGDAEMGLLYGTVFALFYAVFSLPLGRLADGWVRTKLLAYSVLGWSVMTALAGFANGFGLLAISRLGVGIGEASAQPAGMSLLSDSFPKKRRGMISAAMAIAVALGLGAALWIGGTIADVWDARWPGAVGAPLGFKGWQAAFIGAALPGFVLTVLLLRLPEPVRGAADGIAPPHDPHPFRASARTLAEILPFTVWTNVARQRAAARIWATNLAGLALIVAGVIALTAWTDSLRALNPVALRIAGWDLTGNALQWIVSGFGAYVLLNWLQSLQLDDRPTFVAIARSPAMILLITVAALQTIINYGVMAWTPAYLIQHYGVSPANVGLQFGSLITVLGIAGPLIAGPLSDWMESRRPGSRLYVTLASLVVSPFFAVWTYWAEDLTTFYLRFVAFSLTLTMWLPPIYAGFIDLVLPRMRGMVTSFYILSMTILGLGLGPYAVGLISDRNGGDLGAAIVTLFWLSPPIALLTAILAWRFPRDVDLLIERTRAAGEPV